MTLVPDGGVIIDAGPLVAFLNDADRYHAWVVDQFRQLPAPFLTCEPVVAEAFHLVRRVRGGGTKLLQLLDSGAVIISFELIAELGAIGKLVRKYDNLPMSLADACVVRMTELNRGSSVFTIDSHFRIYRKNGRQVIPLIIPPDR